MFQVPEKFRITSGAGLYNSTAADGNNGAFFIKCKGVKLRVIASDGEGWEHVSVSAAARVPTWEEMCCIKDIFWGPEDTVVQYHPPRSDYINCHPYTLHLWRPVGVDFPRPPAIMVGVR